MVRRIHVVADPGYSHDTYPENTIYTEPRFGASHAAHLYRYCGFDYHTIHAFRSLHRFVPTTKCILPMADSDDIPVHGAGNSV